MISENYPSKHSVALSFYMFFLQTGPKGQIQWED